LLGRGGALNWETEVAVGVGSSETLYAAMQALVDAGDEVLLISPAFDIYAAQVTMAGGTPVYVPLRQRAGAWQLDMAELRAALTPRTRLLLLNTPHNPTGKVLTRTELEAVAAILADFPRVVVVADEVYENMLYDGREHVRMVRFALLPVLRPRTPACGAPPPPLLFLLLLFAPPLGFARRRRCPACGSAR
jgi:aspartate/methionine/tyrosine aminotransferase